MRLKKNRLKGEKKPLRPFDRVGALTAFFSFPLVFFPIPKIILSINSESNCLSTYNLVKVVQPSFCLMLSSFLFSFFLIYILLIYKFPYSFAPNLIHSPFFDLRIFLLFYNSQILSILVHLIYLQPRHILNFYDHDLLIYNPRNKWVTFHI